MHKKYCCLSAKAFVIASQPEGFRKCKPRDKEKHSLVRAVDVINGENGEIPVISEVAQGNTRAGLQGVLADGLLGDVQGDGHGEEVSVGQTDIFADTG